MDIGSVGAMGASEFCPPRVPLARVNQVLFGVKRRTGVSGRLATGESPDRSREHLAEGLGRDARALDESTGTARRRRCIARKPRKSRAKTASAPTAGPSRRSVNRPPSITRGGVGWLPLVDGLRRLGEDHDLRVRAKLIGQCPVYKRYVGG